MAGLSGGLKAEDRNQDDGKREESRAQIYAVFGGFGVTFIALSSQ